MEKELYKSLRLYRNVLEGGQSKGSFIIQSDGSMYPATQNKTLWGMASASYIPQEFRLNPNVITAGTNILQLYPNSPVQLPAFFKLAKSPFNIFAEASTMEIISKMGGTTSFNCPVSIGESEEVLYSFLTPEQKEQPAMGTLVFSFLSRNENLFTFSNITKKESPTTSLTEMWKTIDRFVLSKQDETGHSLQEMQAISLVAKQQLSYQFLCRDMLGDVDFSSRNAGIVYNEGTGEIFIAPQFDFGEALNILYTTKIKPLQLESIEMYPEILRTPEIMARVEKNNQARIERRATSPTELAKTETFAEQSVENVRLICKYFPEVAQSFLQDVANLKLTNPIPEIVAKYSGEGNLLTTEQGQMAEEFITARINTYEQRLTENLQQYAPKIVMPEESVVEPTNTEETVVDESCFTVVNLDNTNTQTDTAKTLKLIPPTEQ
ncbi:MAG: hypothetical protein IJB10_04570 [Clostridia bacterium]|nr:hypothetical protein [Clostridia bacterium]